MWPTGKEVDLNEAINYHKSFSEKRIYSKVAQRLRQEGKTVVFPRAGTPIIEQETALNKTLVETGLPLIVAVDPKSAEVVSTVQVPSTVNEDVTIGLREAFRKVEADIKVSDLEKREALACSSAGGGLRMVAIGFVHDLSSEAATRATLGAGAKVVGQYSYQLTRQEVAEIEELSPDIILLAGGTDGGNDKVIVHNAKMLAKSKLLSAHVVMAGNKAVQDKVKATLEVSGKPVSLASNVMPEIGTLDIDPCREVIREIFVRNVVEERSYRI
jgi:uncharacterized protein (TIGR01319 family)